MNQDGTSNLSIIQQPQRSELSQRMSTAVVLIGGFLFIFVAAIYSRAGLVVLTILVPVVIGLAAFELITMATLPKLANSDAPRFPKLVGLGCLLTAGVMPALAGLFNLERHLSYSLLFGAAGLSLIISMAASILLFKSYNEPFARVESVFPFVSFGLIGVGGGSLALIAHVPMYLGPLLVNVIISDIAAYFGGRYFHGPKLSKLVSPGKTWSGALSALLASAIYCPVYAQMLISRIDGTPLLLPGQNVYLISLFMAVGVSVASQLGDLFKSMAKRVVNVKDSGKLLPGHGGVLDRVDGILGGSIIFVLFIGYLQFFLGAV